MRPHLRVRPDRPIEPFFIAALAPILHLLLRIRKAHEPVRVQAFGPEAPAERFDERVVRQLSGPGEVERNAPLLRSQTQIARDGLRALVDADNDRESNFSTNRFQRVHDIGTASEFKLPQREIRLRWVPASFCFQ